MLQTTGKVCGGHYRDSHALRSSPFVCIIDTLMILLKFSWILYLGCSFKVAAQHVWYDRFEKESPLLKDTCQILVTKWVTNDQQDVSTNVSPDTLEEGHNNQYDAPQDLNGYTVSTATQTTENRGLEIEPRRHEPSPEITEKPEPHEGSDIDGMWRLSMASFIVGALPQAIKVFGMRGIPLTQTLVAFLLVSFIIPEVLRLVAGTAGTNDLHPMPTVMKAKTAFITIELYILWLCILFACIVFSYSVFVPLFYASTAHSTYPDLSLAVRAIVGVYTVTIGLTLPIGLVVSRVSYKSWAMRKLVSFCTTITPRWFHELWMSLRSSFATRTSDLLAFSPPLSPLSFEFTIFFVLLNVLHLLYFDYVLPGHTPRFPEPKTLNLSPYLVYYSMAYVVIGIPAFLLLPYLIYRLMFMGSLSRYPRKVFGMKGSVSEFSAGAFILFNVLSSLMGYSFLWYEVGDVNDTYKPGWADALG
jgi:hypothetical protein